MPSVNEWQNNSDPQGSNILSAVKKKGLLCSQLCLQKLQGSLHVAQHCGSKTKRMKLLVCWRGITHIGIKTAFRLTEFNIGGFIGVQAVSIAASDVCTNSHGRIWSTRRIWIIYADYFIMCRIIYVSVMIKSTHQQRWFWVRTGHQGTSAYLWFRTVKKTKCSSIYRHLYT